MQTKMKKWEEKVEGKIRKCAEAKKTQEEKTQNKKKVRERK